ncbi:three component ABC system middle component [Parabacteroides distasonis]|jgi:hypothetical protein|uniref:Uncharacterized protein n=1 Tax=Parabacteroides distasonis TaxID=823 RepID=A0A4S2ENR9_PARDI|nr:three component ABC system middle component [Parabacteroides distasonis]TGY57888.1 hypothetical protein E5342_09330 [Parabacteroides distasonis]
MSKFVENISTLQNNTFILTPLLVSFYRNIKPTEKNMLLAYFVFPLVLNNEFVEKIQRITTASNLSRITKDKDIMAGFEERFYYYKEQTNKCLQYAIDCKYIDIDKNLTVTVINDDNMLTDARLNKNLILASQLYKIFSKNVINTYYAFGIKAI